LAAEALDAVLLTGGNFRMNATASVLIPKIGLVMDATDLKVFKAVARHGSMNRAAAELKTVQSNVTARVRALELELGVLLFQRHARGVKVTPAGRRMLPFFGAHIQAA
jgi:molybdenum-dependent DNA-binding transcriptional regulator ModE